MLRRTLSLILAATLTAGCATYDPATDTRTEVEKAMGTCAASVIGGAIIGAVIGNNTGSGNAGRGAVRGAAVGAGVCVVLLAMANERDKQHIAQTQMLAAQRGGRQDAEYVGDDGLRRRVTVTAQDFQAPAATDNGVNASVRTPAMRTCRRMTTTLEVEGKGRTDVPNDIVCRNADNTWTRTKLPSA